jgi:thioredoxin reductase (NADPH)
MNIPGEDLPKVKHYYDEPHPYAFQKVLVVGGGNSGVDVALETYRCNAEVTMVVRDSELKEGVKYWVKPDIENRIKEGEITAYFNSEVLEIKPESVIIKTPDGIKTIENDFVLAMTGYHPDYSLLKNMNIDFEQDDYQTPIYNDKTHETNKKGIYLAGVVCGGYNTSKWFIENARVHAEQIADHITESITIPD